MRLLVGDITGPSQKCPSQWKKFPSSSRSKTALITFLFTQWMENAAVYAPKLHNRQLVVTCGTSCTVMTSFDGVTVTHAVAPELECTYEEAET